MTHRLPPTSMWEKMRVRERIPLAMEWVTQPLLYILMENEQPLAVFDDVEEAAAHLAKSGRNCHLAVRRLNRPPQS